MTWRTSLPDLALRDDVRQLRYAAGILRERSRKPGSLTLSILCRVLERTADGLDRKADAL